MLRTGSISFAYYLSVLLFSAKHPGPQHPHGPGARPKEPLSKKAKTVDPSGADKQIATEQADEGIILL